MVRVFAISSADLLLVIIVVCRAVIVYSLARIFVSDLEHRKIANRDVLITGVAAAVALVGLSAVTDNWSGVVIAIIVAVCLFAALLIFWFLGKVGAGDVKLIFVAPLVTGPAYLFAFAILLLVFVIAVVVVIRNPLVLPKRIFEKYVSLSDGKGMVPFGVPISAALVSVVVAQTVAMFL